MNADNRQRPDTAPLSQEKNKKADSKDSKLKTLDNEQLDQITGGAGGQMLTSDTSLSLSSRGNFLTTELW